MEPHRAVEPIPTTTLVQTKNSSGTYGGSESHNSFTPVNIINRTPVGCPAQCLRATLPVNQLHQAPIKDRRPDSNDHRFKENVRLWVLLDSQLKIINEKTRKMREKKNELSEHICKHIIDNNIKNKIKIKDGEHLAEIKIYDKKEYSALTFGYIESCLKKIIHDEEQVDYVIEFLKENREITSSPDIRKIIEK